MAKEVKTQAQLAAMIRERLRAPTLIVNIFSDPTLGWYAVAYTRDTEVAKMQQHVNDVCLRLRGRYELAKSESSGG